MSNFHKFLRFSDEELKDDFYSLSKIRKTLNTMNGKSISEVYNTKLF